MAENDRTNRAELHTFNRTASASESVTAAIRAISVLPAVRVPSGEGLVSLTGRDASSCVADNYGWTPPSFRCRKTGHPDRLFGDTTLPPNAARETSRRHSDAR